MVVCICNGIREREVRDAARRGAATTCQAYGLCGKQAKCGQCVPYARAIIAAERAAA